MQLYHDNVNDGNDVGELSGSVNAGDAFNGRFGFADEMPGRQSGLQDGLEVFYDRQPALDAAEIEAMHDEWRCEQAALLQPPTGLPAALGDAVKRGTAAAIRSAFTSLHSQTMATLDMWIA